MSDYMGPQDDIVDVLTKLADDIANHGVRANPLWIRRAADEIERLRALTTWQPIETAPKDGTWVVGYASGAIFRVRWVAEAPPEIGRAHV